MKNSIATAMFAAVSSAASAGGSGVTDPVFCTTDARLYEQELLVTEEFIYETDKRGEIVYKTTFKCEPRGQTACWMENPNNGDYQFMKLNWKHNLVIEGYGSVGSAPVVWTHSMECKDIR